MPGIFLIDEAKRKKFALWGVIISLMFLHVWASALVLSVLISDKEHLDGHAVESMYSSIMTAIMINLLLLISDKAVDFLLNRFSGGGNNIIPSAVTETLTHTISTDSPKDGKNDMDSVTKTL